MAEVTYYVALPFIATDDGIAAGEPTECFNPNAAVMRAEALSRKECHVGAVGEQLHVDKSALPLQRVGIQKATIGGTSKV